jgi:hypothetical protein
MGGEAMTPRDILRDALTGPLPGATVRRVLELLDCAGMAVVGRCEGCAAWADWAPTPDDGSRWCSSTDCNTDPGEGCTRWQEREP